jgi:hypothetical protein
MLQDPGGDGHRRVLGVAAGGEGVGLGVGGHVELGHGHAGGLRELAHHRVVLGHLLFGDGPGPGRLDGQLVAEPVGATDHHEAEHEADGGPVAACHPTTDEHQQAGQARQHHDGLELVGHEDAHPFGM